MPHIDFIERVHTATKRNYLLRVTEADKAECATLAKQFGKDYFDGDRTTGYGGYHYDGRWRPVADSLIQHYKLRPGDRVLDLGCGKGFLVYDLIRALPGLEVFGLDLSAYALEHSMPEVKDRLQQGNVVSLPFEDRSFDLVLAINTLHNLRLPQLEKALREIQRVQRRASYIVNDAYRTEREKVNLMYWQLTCECFFTPEEWEWVFQNVDTTATTDSSVSNKACRKKTVILFVERKMNGSPEDGVPRSPAKGSFRMMTVL